jgi:alcohol dehydrogenase (cytochrome c)
VITYVADGAQKVAVAYGFSNLQWPVKVATAKIEILGLEDKQAAHQNPTIAMSQNE